MISISRCFVSACLLLTLSACVTTNAARLGTASADRPPIDSESVALYRTADQVPRKYEEIALLNSSGDSGFTDEAKMFESMREKAGEMGANAVILDAVSEPGSGAKVAAAIFGVSAQRKGKALAIWIFPVGFVPPGATVSVATAGAGHAAGTEPLAIEGPTPMHVTTPMPAVATPAAEVAPTAPAGATCVSCQKIGKNL